jgi:glycosyltransferase involved in cell wall biosynthesis
VIPRVLLVTGAYYPEISAAGVQCRAAASALRGQAVLSVLATAVNPALPRADVVDGIPVRRVIVNVSSRASKAVATVRMVRELLQSAGSCDIIHVHGFSQKNVPVSIVARLLGKHLVLTLHTSGQDEPDVVKRQGAVAYWAFRSADLVLSVSHDLKARWCDARLPADRIRVAPNGIDTERFRPADREERAALRRALGWPATEPVVLFVGFFSRDKRPDLLFRAWRRLGADGIRPRLAFVGAKRSAYYEIDQALADRIARDAADLGRAGDVIWIEPTTDVERCFRAADAFVLPSVREAHPLALLEAMACGLPCAATRIAGATDVLITDGQNGRLFPADDEAAAAEALRDILTNEERALAMGARAREMVLERYDIRRTAGEWLSAYETVMQT